MTMGAQTMLIPNERGPGGRENEDLGETKIY